MKLLYKFVILCLMFGLISCAKDKKKISEIKEINQEKELTNTYKEGVTALEEGDYYIASKKFLESELLFPQSIWAPKSSLMASYAYYMLDDYSSTKNNLERYMEIYPDDKNRVYAEYLLGMCYYETIEDETLDQEPLINARKQFKIVVEKHPDTDFALDARFKLELINDILAAKEMYIGRYYTKTKKWVAAINRFKNILENYETTIYTEEAIHRLVEIYYHIGLQDESKKYANLLGYNYLSGEWYKKSYILFNKNYENKTNKLKKDKKKKNKARKVLDTLFN